MILVIDNYDSFVYNLVQYLGELGKRTEVYRNDYLSLKEIERKKPESILISPGPGRPEEAGTSLIHHYGKDIYQGVENPFVATRYHSLIIKNDSLPTCLVKTAWTAKDEIMGVRHREYPVFGMQFHPESILTKAGKALLKNFLNLIECIHLKTWQIPI